MASEQFYRVTEYIDNHFSEKPGLGILCNQFFSSPSYTNALFQKKKHMTFSQYVTHKSLDCTSSLMRIHLMLSTAVLGEMVGYKDCFYFAKVFQKDIGCTPSTYI